MKGITPVISIIILLLITISLSGMGWTYMSGYYATMTSKSIRIVYGSESENGVMIMNTGTSDIEQDELSATVNGKEVPIIEMTPSILKSKKSARLVFRPSVIGDNTNVRVIAPGSVITYTLTISIDSCQEYLDSSSLMPDGTYWIEPAGASAPFEVYCDMTNEGGGWTLVLLNSPYSTPPKPNWNEVVNENNIEGQLSTDLTSFDQFLGAKYWNSIGNKMRVEVGSDPSSISHRATYDFSLDAKYFYALSMSNENVLIGGTSPGMHTYHAAGSDTDNTPVGVGYSLTSYDADHDDYGTNCANSYSNTAWWYGSCWSGSFWGGGDADGYTNNPYWTSSGGDYYAWGAIWIK